MLWPSARERREARDRAPGYARYYLDKHGSAAETRLIDKIASTKRASYWGYLYRLTLREVRGIAKRRARRSAEPE
jgi:hypothetical protein